MIKYLYILRVWDEAHLVALVIDIASSVQFASSLLVGEWIKWTANNGPEMILDVDERVRKKGNEFVSQFPFNTCIFEDFIDVFL